MCDLRRDLIEWARRHPGFLEALEPVSFDPGAPALVRAMSAAADRAGVGPMAAVAGAIAQHIGENILERFGLEECVVENGGDLWISVREPLTVGVYAGLSSLSGTFGLVIDPRTCPCGVATSSAKIGPSRSFGNADVALAIARDAAAADAWATALGNRARTFADAKAAVDSLTTPRAERTDALSLEGALVVFGDRLVAAGNVRLAPLQKKA